MKTCIVCQKETTDPNAAKVKEDPVIRFIRGAKQRVGIAKNNELYVCPADLEAHAKRRKGFENNLVFSSLIAAVFVLILVALPLLAGRINLFGIASSVLIGVLIVVVVVFFRYTPALEKPAAAGSLLIPSPPPPSVPPAPAPSPAPEKPVGKAAGKKR